MTIHPQSITLNLSLALRKLLWGCCMGGVVCLLSSCDSYLDEKKIETAISEGLTEQTGLTVDTVQCPEKEPIEEKAVFQCVVTLADSQTFDAQVTQQDDQGNIRWEAQEGLRSLKGLIDNSSLEKQISEGIQEQTEIQVTTDCGGAYRVARQGESFTCTATDVQKNRSQIQVKAQDDQGNVSWELK